MCGRSILRRLRRFSPPVCPSYSYTFRSMQAFGSDRVRVADDGRVLLSSRVGKGWTTRVEKTLTTAEFPGTAVLWSYAYYEVVDAEPLPSGGVRYTLLPWRDAHAMRVVDRY